MARKIAQCGTRSRYNKHLRDSTEVCAECREANTTYYREKYQNDLGYRTRVLEQMNVKSRERYLNDEEYREKEKARSKQNYKRRYAAQEFREELSRNRKRWAENNLDRRRET